MDLIIAAFLTAADATAPLNVRLFAGFLSYGPLAVLALAGVCRYLEHRDFKRIQRQARKAVAQ